MQALTRGPAQVVKRYPPRILQFGGGNFVRAYFDWMVEVMNETTGFEGSVIVVKPTAGGDYAQLREQEGLFYVQLDGVRGGQRVAERRLITCIERVIHPYRAFLEFLDTAGLPTVQYIVSNTTEAGIRFIPEPWLEHGCPQEFPAKLARWLYRRWHRLGPESPTCHVLPLELIEANGYQLQQCILRYAGHWQLPEDFQEWVRDDVRFYDTLVDRIVSGYPADAKRVWRETGLRDELLVAGEHYHSLVVQAPPAGVPGLPFVEAGLDSTYADDLRPYRERKVRLLNGAHTAIVPVGYLAGLDSVGAVMDDAEVSAYLEQVLYREIIPTLDQPQEELRAFAATVLDRFRNPSLHHKLLDISLNSTTKFRTRLLPSLLAYHRRFGALPTGIVRALGALIVFYRGRRGEEAIPLRDEADRIAFFARTWQEAGATREVARRVLGQEDWWGQDLNRIPELTEAVAAAIDQSREE